MAAIAFGAPHRTAHVRRRLTTVLAAFREIVDAFVSNRMRRTVAEADHIPPRQRPIAIGRNLVIAVQSMSPEVPPREPSLSTPVEQERARAGHLPVDGVAKVTTQFQPLDPAIVNEAIPAFFIGRNKEGFWIARDVNGQIGGIFLLENSALSFARSNSGPAVCATIYPTERIELDLENKGNPLVAQLGLLVRLASSARRLIADCIGRMTGAVKRQLKGL